MEWDLSPDSASAGPALHSTLALTPHGRSGRGPARLLRAHTHHTKGPDHGPEGPEGPRTGRTRWTTDLTPDQMAHGS